MDREDIHLLSTGLSHVADYIGGTAQRAISLRATTRREPAVALARLIHEAASEIEAAIRHLRVSRLSLRVPEVHASSPTA